LFGLANIAAPAFAQHQFSHRQYYGDWQRHPTHGYSFRPYYFKPTPTFNGFKHHYVIHHPSRPQHLFFYNPYKKQYWGRCPVDRPDGVGRYSLLAEKDRKGSLKDIPESAFPEPGDVPPIPDSTDDQPLDLPPDDLPLESTAVPGKE
jgi:hypothetical protein